MGPTYQKQIFSNGGFVLHNVPYNNGKLSIWVYADGALNDVAQFDRNGKECRASAGAISKARSVAKIWVAR